jgi:hypothetical protein
VLEACRSMKALGLRMAKLPSGLTCNKNSLALDRAQPEGIEETLQIVVAIILDLNASSLFALMNDYSRPEMLLQSILQIGNRHRSDTARIILTPSPRARGPKVTRD